MLNTVTIPKLPVPFKSRVPVFWAFIKTLPTSLLVFFELISNGAAFQLLGCQWCGSSGFNWIPALAGAFKDIVPEFIILDIVVLFEASALLNPKAIWLLFILVPSFASPVIVPALSTVKIAGADLLPWCVPCKSIPTFWLFFKFIFPL